MVYWAEGSPEQRVRPDWDDAERAIWRDNFPLNRLCMAGMIGAFIQAMILPFSLGTLSRNFLVDSLGAFGCGCLAWVLLFVLASRGRPVARYQGFRRFEAMRYPSSVPSIVVVGPGSVVGLGWLFHFAWSA